MAIVVNTNGSSLSSQRMLENASAGLGTTTERLASGFRINRAADDAAGLVITHRLTSQVEGLEQARRNANDAISLTQVAEGGMDEIFTALQRMRVLTIQSENGINNEQDIAALQSEFDLMTELINRIAINTEFNGKTLLDGSLGTLQFQTGANAQQYTPVTLDRRFTTDSTGLSLDGILLGQDTSEQTLAAIDSAIKLTDEGRTELGAMQNALFSTLRNLGNVTENVSASRGRIRDTDYAKETTELTRTQILQQTSTTVLAQANQRPQAAIFVLSG